MSARVYAAELSGPEEGVVPYGMGRAYSAVAEDGLALYYNPAGLAMVNRLEFQAFDLKLQSNSDTIKTVSLVKDLGNNSSSSLANTLGKFAGKHVLLTGSDVTQITVPHFALGMVYDTHTDFDLENLSYPTTQMRYTKDLSLVAGGAISSPNKALRLGASIKYMNRTGGVRTIPISEITGSKAAITSLFSQSGSGFGGDFGMQYRFPVPGRVEYTSSFVWHDIGETSFGGPGAQNPPTAIPQDMVAGLGIRIPIGGMKNRRLERRYGPTRSNSSLSLAFDYDHLNISPNQEALVKHFHTGMNLDLPILSLQMGLNQSYFTYGFSFDIGIVKVAAASYGEELGSYAGQHSDRRYLLSVGSSFGFSAAK
ncbi:MAG: hypothetical protein ACXVB9_05610 [Bdellovibrionota bacterium]